LGEGGFQKTSERASEREIERDRESARARRRKGTRAMATTNTFMDGKSLKAFVENDNSWKAYVDEKFASLDKSHTGKLTHTELQPAIAAVGSALGLPPMGESPETDHIYTEMFSEFGNGGEGISKERFGIVLRDILLGLGDGLEREPVAISALDGTTLEQYGNSKEFEVDAITAFSTLDTDQKGSLPASAIKTAMQRLSVDQGMPPQTDVSVSEQIQKAFKMAGIQGDQSLNQYDFVEVYRKAILALAECLKGNPLTVAHTEKTFDGSSITVLLKDKPTLDAALNEAWQSMPRSSGGTVPKQYLRVGLDVLAPYAGLPPVGAVEEMDYVVNEAFKVLDADAGGSVDRQDFDKSLLEVIGSIMLQLSGKPIGVQSSGIVPPQRATSGIMPF